MRSELACRWALAVGFLQRHDGRVRTASVTLIAGVVLGGCHGCHEATRSGAQRPAAVAAAGSPALEWREVAGAAPAPGSTIFWEAERPRKTDFPAENPFAPANAAEAEVLSGGAWVGAESKGRAFFLEYEIDVPNAATYSFYARKFWRHGPCRFRFDEQPWRSIGGEVALLDQVLLRPMVPVNWVSFGRVALGSGKHVLRIELDQGHGASAWDAFALVDGPFAPRGKLHPGEPETPAAPPWFVFDPAADHFGASPIDLRSMNESVAGAAGPVVVEQGAFVRASDRQPLRFWGVNLASELVALPDAELRYMARSLAKRGVNLVRIQGPLWKDDALAVIDPERLSNVQRTVQALAREGIYSELCIFFPLWLKLREQDGFEGYHGNDPAFVLPFADERFATLYRGWWKQILETPNPATGIPLAKEPALAIVELVNEDSTLFWTFRPYETIPEATTIALERRFGAWLASRYGSLERAFGAWKEKGVRGDDVHAGRAGFIGLWSVANDRTQRGRDTAEFLARMMRRFYEQTYAFVKSELGFRGSVVCSNWITADGRRLGPLDKWANEVCDVMDHHGYYGGPDVGPAAGYLLSAGDEYDDASALRFDSDDKDDRSRRRFDLPVMDVSYDGKPSLVSEINWPMPNRFRAELPFLVLAYGSLQGTSGYLFFDHEVPAFARALTKFGTSDPAVLGQFPALALAFRKGYVRRGEPVAQAWLSEAKLFALEGTQVRPAENLDLLRKIPGLPKPEPSVERVDALASLVGRVEFHLAGRDAEPVYADLAPYVKHDEHTVASTTRELSWDHARGVVTLDAPRVQGAVGFLGARGRVELRDVDIELDTEYASAVVVSLDDLPLATSKRMLVQVVTEVTNRGFSAPGTGVRRIQSVGGPPLLVKRTSGKLTFHRDGAKLAFAALDGNGYPTREARPAAPVLSLLPDALYYLVSAE